MTEINHQILLRSKPTGIPKPGDFIADSVPARAPAADEVLLETIFLSIDPAMRSWMSEAVPLGTVMRGGGIARVLESRADGFKPGELVQARLGWQTYPTIPAKYLQKIDLARGDALAWIGPLGLSAVTAYFGMQDIAAVKPGDRVLVSGAAGGVGQIATQIARIEACHVVGIAGGAAKCAFLSNELRLDGVIDYKAEPDLATAIGRACPDEIDSISTMSVDRRWMRRCCISATRRVWCCAAVSPRSLPIRPMAPKSRAASRAAWADAGLLGFPLSRQV